MNKLYIFSKKYDEINKNDYDIVGVYNECHTILFSQSTIALPDTNPEPKVG